MYDDPRDLPTSDVPFSDSDTVNRFARMLHGTDLGPIEQAGDEIGHYRLISAIGEGGFGSVWIAERRQPFRHRVALKLIKAGMDSKAVIARFEQERQALALMSHASIAKVLDGGLTKQGRPYFAMEYVKGEPITDFCDSRRLGIKERLELFTQACEAIQHAHVKGIVHRDIKPSNILAFELEGEGPRLKVIDFGVAKALDHTLTDKTIFTETGQMIGTPAYMSPEQADPSRSDIDTRSDVYALGVLLYELIAGATPFDAQELRAKAYGEIQRTIREVDPPSPSARLSTISTKDAGLASKIEKARGVEIRELAKELRRELEWIPLKAMRKERQHRYQSPMALADDIRNYLDGKPLLAAPESTGYRLRKYVRRNNALVIGVGAVASAMVLGMAVSLLLLQRALGAESELRVQLAETAQAQHREQQRAAELAQVSNFQSEMLLSIDTERVGVELINDLHARLIAAQGKEALAEEKIDSLLAEVNATDLAAAMVERTFLRPALDTIETEFRDQPVVATQLRQTLANLYLNLGKLDIAYSLQESVLATRRRVLGDEHPDTIDSIACMGEMLRVRGEFAEAEPYVREALESSRRLLGDENPDTLGAIHNMGRLLLAQSRFAEAERCFREALAKRRRVLGDDALDTLQSVDDLGRALGKQGAFSEAEMCFREVLEKRRRALGEEHPDTLWSINNLANLKRQQGNLVEAEPLLREVLEKSRHALGDEHLDTLTSINNLGQVLLSQGKFAEAEPYLQEALEKRRRVLGDDHPHTIRSMYHIGVLLQRQGKFAEAEVRLLDALERHRRVQGARNPSTLDCLHALVDLYAAWNKQEPAAGFGVKASEWKVRLDAASASESTEASPRGRAGSSSASPTN